MERWETRLVSGNEYEIDDKVNELARGGWEPFGYSVAIDAAYCEHFVMLRRKINPSASICRV